MTARSLVGINKARFILVAAASLAFLGGCGGKPDITNTSVNPSSWSISGFSNTAQFTITTDVLYLAHPVSSVVATVEGHSDLTYNLVKQESVAGGERWSISTQLTLWNGISNGTYYVDIMATDTSNTTVTQPKAATITITN